MDLNDDGHDDLISGSYWPGDIFLFPGLGNGKFGARERLLDADGVAVTGARGRDDDNPDRAGLAAAPWMIDWDADGDLDLLIGNITGNVVLVENIGDASEPRFAVGDRTTLRAGGATLQVGGGDAGPTTADWNGDGLWDLLVGAGDGTVYVYDNVGEAGAPSFAAGRTLVAKGSSNSYTLEPGQAVDRPQRRTKAHVVDFDLDGDLDLLVGDYFRQAQPEPELSPEQVARRDELQRKAQRAISKMTSRSARLSREERGTDEKYLEYVADWRAIREELAPLVAETQSLGGVWLYRRGGSDKLAAARAIR